MKADSVPHHVMVGNAESGEGESMAARGGEGVCAGHYGVVAWNPSIVLVDGYLHGFRPESRERYTLRVSMDGRSYAVCDVDLATLTSASGHPDRVEIPTLALYVPARAVPPPQDAHWEQPDSDEPYDLRWELRGVDTEPKLKMFLAYRIIAV
ncbi:hypothetical protein [Azospirillum canadense]|uniref:hypothetical protein n=1 Tax=Azospirillum canadense TaxID=403962 RepID=UPI002227016C|nr:hypothetical protein [Azospirillum canadense]MCW2239368.1 hypothetical protein [Azospirillum canadense]